MQVCVWVLVLHTPRAVPRPVFSYSAHTCLCDWLSVGPAVWVTEFSVHGWMLQSVRLHDCADERQRWVSMRVQAASVSQPRDNQAMPQQPVGRRVVTTLPLVTTGGRRWISAYTYPIRRERKMKVMMMKTGSRPSVSRSFHQDKGQNSCNKQGYRFDSGSGLTQMTYF